MTPMLLLQAPAGLEGEIASHPYVTVLVISLVFTALVGLAKLFLIQFENRVNEKFASIAKHDEGQDARLDSIEADLRRYDAHVAVGVKESSEIHDAVRRVEVALSDHVRKEEGTTWAKLDGIVTALADMKTSNEVAHERLASGQELLAARVTVVEKKMPNGELSRLAEAYAALAEQVGVPRRKMR